MKLTYNLTRGINMNNNMPDFVIVSGFYATGASAVIDYLKEFKCCT